MCKVLIVHYSMYGHVFKMAEAIAAGVREVPGCEAVVKRVPETLPAEVLTMMGALDAQAGMAHVPIATVNDLAEADAIIFGTPTRFGNMCGQMRQFLDATGGLWLRGALVGKVGSVFTSSATQHGGQESTILSTHVTLLHHGLIIVGLPYAFAGQIVKSDSGKDVLSAITRGFYSAAVISAVMFGAFTMFYTKDPNINSGNVIWQPLAAVLIGVVLAIVIDKVTAYFTDTEHAPVKEIARNTQTGPATTIVSGLASGMESSVWAVLVTAPSILASWPIFTYFPITDGNGQQVVDSFTAFSMVWR